MFKNWKTTVAGIGAFLTAIATQVGALTDGDPTTIVSWSVIITAAMVMLGLGQASDSKDEPDA